MQTQYARPITPALLARHEAGRRAMETLLNCYCREVAGPQGQLQIGPLFGQGDWPQSVHVAMRSQGGSAMHVTLPMTETRLLTVVEHASRTGNYRYRSPFYHKAPGKPWALLDGEDMTALLLRELALQTDTPPNDELRAQIRDSVTVTTAILQSAQPGPFPADPLDAYIASEQSLVYGHPFHPAPKSRQGVSHDDMLRYSPEMGAGFPLHYFAVRREYLLQQSLLDTSCDHIVAAQAPAGLCDDAEAFALMPTHPWQARYLLAHSDVQAALHDGHLRDLGMQGAAYLPTSSIRTLFHPENPYFYKCSLNIRITNCVRKNAVYELEGALQVTRLMRTLLPDLQARFPDLEVMEEPAYQSVDLRLGDAQRDKEVTEGFGMILRRGFDGSLRPGATPLLAGALFGNHTHGEARMREMLLSAMPYRAAAEQWFAKYAERLMMPVLHCYFAYGVVFEPHLQNVVIAVGEDGPQQLYLRDFEGVKLVRERYGADQLQGISPQAREALWYGADLGWNRIVYCLFVNNLCEAIAQLGAGDPALQQRLWRIVRAQLERYQQLHGDMSSSARIQPLMAGLPFAGKTNLMNRFFKRADRATTYVPVANPLQSCLEDAAWN